MDMSKSKETHLPELEPFIPDFLSKRYADFAEISAALKKNDNKKVQSIVHQWKGFCEPYGFPQLVEIAREYETDVKNGEKIDNKVFLSKIETYLEFKKSCLENGNFK